MAKIINITDKFELEQPKIKVGDIEIEVDTSLNAILKLEEKIGNGSGENLIEAIEVAIGKEGVEKLNLRNTKMSNIMVVLISVLAIAQDMEYEEADAVFRRKLAGK